MSYKDTVGKDRTLNPVPPPSLPSKLLSGMKRPARPATVVASPGAKGAAVLSPTLLSPPVLDASALPAASKAAGWSHPSATLPPPRSPKKRPSPLSLAAGVPRSLKRSSQSVDTRSIRNDRLGTLVRQLSAAYETAPSWESFVTEFRGRSYLAPMLEQLDHPAAELLCRWRNDGVPAETDSSPWTDDQKDLCIQRGCHLSAKEHSSFLRDEMAEFIESRFWVVLPYRQVRHLPSLQLSPAAVKEERDRKPRVLCDHSWPWGWPPVNETTLPHAPPEAMQFGGALPRILRTVRHANPKFGPVRLSKHDIKDGFYRLFLRATDCPRLALVLPRYPDEAQLVAIPMACTMGWVQSPPTFSTMSETVCDRANHRLAHLRRSPLHRLEALAEPMDDISASWTPCPRGSDDDTANQHLQGIANVSWSDPEPPVSVPPSNSPLSRPVGQTDVFVDDFIQLGQGGARRMKKIRRELLHAIDEVLAQPGPDEAHRNEAVSLKKLLKGDGSWATRKLILGWVIDTVRQTIELPPHRKEALATIFEELATTRRVSNKKWQIILGKLRFVSVAVPGSAGLFSALQLALNRAKGNRIRINASLRLHINTFANLAASLCHRPTHLAEIVPERPRLLGATDAARQGMGGVFFEASGKAYVWRYPFPQDVQDALITAENPEGTITNSDLEQAGLLAQAALMADTHNVAYATLANGSDNTPAVSRLAKGAVSSEGPAARLCNWACAHQRQHRYCHQVSFLPGDKNTMADDASRLQLLTDAAFVSHFQQHYPQPRGWQQLHLASRPASELISALRCSSPLRAPPPRTERPRTLSSATGLPSAASTVSSHPFVTSWAKRPSSPTCWSLGSDTATEGGCKTPSEVAQWIRPSWQWARGSPTWVSSIHAKKFQDPNETIPYSALSSRASRTKTTLHHAATLPMSPSSVRWPRPWTPPMKDLAAPTMWSSSSRWWPSSGFSAQQSTWPPKTPKADLKPFGSATSTLSSTTRSTAPQTLL